MKKMACILALATGAGLGLGIAARSALADPLSLLVPNGLQIAIVSSGAVNNGHAVALDVSYRGGSVQTIEFYVDGKQIKRKTIVTRSSHGVITFEVDASLLAEGMHEVMVKAFESDGTCATSTSRITVGAPTDSATRFAYPKNNTTVQGTVPIEVELSASINKPYVSFFVDNDLLGLTNFAPFSFNLDSTHLSNGPHTITVHVFDGESYAEVKQMNLRVTVNNVGGYTNLQHTTPDLNAKKDKTATSNPISKAVKQAAELAGPRIHADVNAPGELFSRFLDPLRADKLRGASPAERLDRTGSVAIAKRDHNPPPTRYSVTKPNASTPGIAGMLASPRELAANSAPEPFGKISYQNAQLHHSGNIAARPAMTLGTAFAAPANANMHGKPGVQTTASEHSYVGAGSVSGRSFQVAFDNTQIAFDVQPRIENGLPLAPFRAIFEHTGGKIQWFNRSKTLRAVNATREIQFKVGTRTAKVNNKVVKMAVKSYIDHSRTIVPLSFVADALDVLVSYDKASGRMRIESKSLDGKK